MSRSVETECGWGKRWKRRVSQEEEMAYGKIQRWERVWAWWSGLIYSPQVARVQRVGWTWHVRRALLIIQRYSCAPRIYVVTRFLLQSLIWKDGAEVMRRCPSKVAEEAERKESILKDLWGIIGMLWNWNRFSKRHGQFKLMFKDDQDFVLGRHWGTGRNSRWEGGDKEFTLEHDDSEIKSGQEMSTR